MTQRTRNGQGGNQGGNPPGNPPNHQHPANAVYQEARNEFRVMMAPYLNSLKQANRQARQQTRQTVARTQDVYGALGTQLQGLDAPLQSNIASLGNNLSSQTAALAPMMQNTIGQAPASEQAAGSNLVGTIGQGGLNTLAQIGATGAASNASAQRQGIEESAIGQRNALTDLANFRQSNLQQRTDLMAQAPSQLRSLIDNITQRNLQNRLSQEQIAISQGNLGVSQGSLAESIRQANLANTQANIDNQAYQQWLALQGGP